jgi:hypothetical protein
VGVCVCACVRVCVSVCVCECAGAEGGGRGSLTNWPRMQHFLVQPFLVPSCSSCSCCVSAFCSRGRVRVSVSDVFVRLKLLTANRGTSGAASAGGMGGVLEGVELQLAIFQIPCRPDKVYRGQGWESWAKWLNSSTISISAAATNSSNGSSSSSSSSSSSKSPAEVDIVTTELEFEPQRLTFASSAGSTAPPAGGDVAASFDDWWALISQAMAGDLNPVEEHA